MSNLIASLQFFHFIRPGWLAMIPIAVFAWWFVRPRPVQREDHAKGLAPHLAAALTVGNSAYRRFYPVDGVVLVLIFLIVGAAGPTWSRVPNPLVAQVSPLAVVLKVSQSMLNTDVAPDRLERSKQKILDLVTARAGGRVALIAYAGTAHNVAPLTEDPNILRPFLEGLTPDVMPSDGQNATAALELAEAALAGEEVAGSVLFVLDSLDRADMPAFTASPDEAVERPHVVFLSVGGSDAEVADLNQVPGADVVTVTTDESDINEINRRVESAYRDAILRDERQKWEDRGWVFTWPALLLALLWFRRGWVTRTAVVLIAGSIYLDGPSARAEGIADWFFTADQQGAIAYRNKDYARAAELFEDPMWKGQALTRAGKYEEAIEVYSRVPTSEAAFAQGNASIRNRNYRDGVRAYEVALERDPSNEAAARNLEIAKVIVIYVEDAREASDTGEEGGIGADDIVFDNESGRGAETQIEASSEVQPETAEQWMRTVDTDTSEFLKSRFQLEAVGGGS